MHNARPFFISEVRMTTSIRSYFFFYSNMFSIIVILIVSILSTSCANMDIKLVDDAAGTQVKLAASGRFDQLEQLLEQEEARHPLNTRDLHALCFAYSKTKHYDKLMPCLNKLEATAAKGDRRTRLFGLDDVTPMIYITRADALIELAQYAPAALEAKKALDWLKKEKSNDSDIEINALTALSLAATHSGDKKLGSEYAAEIERINNTDYANAKAMALGRVYIALGNYQRALDGINSDPTFKLRAYLDNLVSGALFSGVSNWAWAELPRGFMINKALLETGQIAEAKSGYDQLLSISQVRANGEIYRLILEDRGRIAELEGELDSAINYYRKAIDIIEQQRATINTEANKIGFVGDKQAVYGRLISLFHRTQRTREAYEYMERSKSRALVDLLAEKENFSVSPTTTAEATRLLKIYRESDRESRFQLPMDMSQTFEQRTVNENNLNALKETVPELASLVSVSPISLQEIQQKIQPNEVIMEYYLRGIDLYTSVITTEQINTFRLDATDLENNIRIFREQIENRNEGIKNQAQKLYNQLFAPLITYIKSRELLIIPHGVLHYLPFTALHDGKDYIIQNYAIHYLPSSGVIKYIRPTRSKNLEFILVFGNPDLGNARFDLPNAEEEARVVAKLIPNSELLVRKKATKSAFKKFSPSFPYIHIASHGEFVADDPLSSRLLLASDDESNSSLTDGSLTVGELYSLRLDSDLITLSACETGLGKILNGDDMLGLTRGFLYAGSRNIISSLWQVDDAATSEIMQIFYMNLKKSQTKLEALRHAQLETKKKYPHPFYWSAFILTGQGI
ncbi:CHAT domain-containing protein [Gammaproteobacteria bacterium]